MIWATIATILVGLGTSAEQSRAARLLGSEVPAKRKLRSDNLINDNKEERTPEKFGIEDFFADKIPETIDEILSSVPHQHSDPAVPAVAKFHPPPHQHSDGAVSTVSQQPVLTFDEPFKYSHERSDYAVFTLDTLFLPPQQGSDAAVGPWTHLPMFTFDEHYLSPHQHSDAAVSTVPHQYPEAAVPTIDDFHVPYNDVKGQLDIVYKYVGFTKAEDRHAQWLKKNTHPTKVFGDLKFLPGNNLLVQIPTFRWIYYVDQYNKKNPLHPIKLLGVLKNKNYDEEAVIKSVCFPNMDKEVIAQTSGMVQVQHIGSRKDYEVALIDVQQYAKTRLTQGLIQSWLGDRLSVATVIVRLGLSPEALDTGYDFSRYKILVMYEINWNLQHRPKTFTSLQANALMKLWGYTLEDFKTLNKQSDQESALSLALAKWIQTHENGNANVSGKKRKEREF